MELPGVTESFNPGFGRVAAVEVAAARPCSAPSTIWPFGWPADVFAAWGQWAGGIGSILAVAVAVIVLIRDRRLHNKEMTKLRAEQVQQANIADAARRSRQLAETSAVVIEFKPMRRPNSNSMFPGVRISNHGSAPMLDVVVFDMVFTDGEGVQHADWALRNTAVWNATPRPGPLKATDALGPREDVELPGLGIDGVSVEMLNWGTADITFAFRDVEEQWWRRVSGGAPARI